MSKRLFDLLGAALGILLCSPLLILIACWIKLDSKGPVFFRQERIGKGGRPFRIHKFRTMVIDAEARGLQLTTGEDPRITPSGRFLRKYKLDELAQLFDVFSGEMSFVGPRPEVPKYVAHYSEEIKKIALSVKPGITDFASIEYRDENDILSHADDPEAAYIHQVLPVKLKYHKRYVQEQSFWLDIYLILKTATLVFGRWMPDGLNILGALTRNQKRLIMLTFDTIALPLAFWSAFALLQDSSTPDIAKSAWLFPLIPLISVPVFIHLGLYRAVIRYMEDKSFYTILLAVSLSAMGLFTASVLAENFAEVHKPLFVVYWLIALFYIGGTRTLARSYYRKAFHLKEQKKRIIIYGAGNAGVQLALGLIATGRKIPVAFIDDNPNLHHHEICGIHVYPPSELARLIDEIHVDHILLAIPSTPETRHAEILESLRKLHMHVLPMPTLSQLIQGMTVGSQPTPSR